MLRTNIADRDVPFRSLEKGTIFQYSTNYFIKHKDCTSEAKAEPVAVDLNSGATCFFQTTTPVRIVRNPVLSGEV